MTRIHKLPVIALLACLGVFVGGASATAAPLASDDVYVALSDENRFVHTITPWSTYFCVGQEVCKVGDVDGDGDDDIIALVRSTGGGLDSDVYVALSNGVDGFGPTQQWQNYFCTREEICEVGDVDGDGDDDLISFVHKSGALNNSPVYVALSNGVDGFVHTIAPWSTYFCVGEEICKVGDVDGDGDADVIAFVRSSGGEGDSDVYVALSDGEDAFGPPEKWSDYFCTGQEICEVGDVDHDGDDDVIAFVRSNGNINDSDVYVALSNGADGFGPPEKWSDYFCTQDEICAVGDVTGDARDDIVAFVRSNGGINDSDIYVARSLPAADGLPQRFGLPEKWQDYFCTQQEICGLGDFDGDGDHDAITFVRARNDTPAAADPIRVTISLYRRPTEEERVTYTIIIEHFADAIYEMTNGAHRVGNVTFNENDGTGYHGSIRWVASAWPAAPVGGIHYQPEQLLFADVFSFAAPYDAMQAGNERGAGYTLAHEWGHFYYGLYDEYRASRVCNAASPTEADITAPWACDVAVQNSVMSSQWNAAAAGGLGWLNFSIAANQTAGNANLRVYGASGWEVLARSPNLDPRVGVRRNLHTRVHYDELADVAPGPGQAPTIELPNSAARSALRIFWFDAPQRALAQGATPTGNYRPSVHSLSGPAILYPEAARLVASLLRDGELIAKADVSATLTEPGGTPRALLFRDDGVSPDAEADDGLYSTIMPYARPGAHHVAVTFSNSSGRAEFSYKRRHYTPGPNGETFEPAPQPVGESFTEQASADILVTGFLQGLTGQLPPTRVTLDNRDFPGRIDAAADKDVFTFVPETGSEVVLRLTDLALGMLPYVRIYKGDPPVLMAEYRFTPVGDRYFFTKLQVEAGERYRVEVEHTDPAAGEGLFNISVGPGLANTVETQPAWRLFLAHLGQSHLRPPAWASAPVLPR